MSRLLGCEWPPFLTSDPEGGSGQYACWTSMDPSMSRDVQQLHVGCSVAGEIVNRRVCLVHGPRPIFKRLEHGIENYTWATSHGCGNGR